MFLPPPRSTLFPYTTLFRSHDDARPRQARSGRRVRLRQAQAFLRQGRSYLRGAEMLVRSEEHTSELQSRRDLVCRLLLEKKNRLTYSLTTIIHMTNYICNMC